MIVSNIVEKNFSRDPVYYHKHAGTQRCVAEKLAGLIPDQPFKNILEIGCGTGFLTRQLLQKYPMANFTVTDLSKSMLDFCQQQTLETCKQQQIAAKFAVNDISNTCPQGQFDLIISSLAFQWIRDLEAIVKQLKSSLLPGGMLIFSTLSQGTFASIKQIFAAQQIAFPGPELLTKDEIKQIFGHFGKVQVSEEELTENFDSILMFLRHIQGTGAGNASGKLLSAKDLKKILQNSDKICAEFHITYVWAQV